MQHKVWLFFIKVMLIQSFLKTIFCIVKVFKELFLLGRHGITKASHQAFGLNLLPKASKKPLND